MMHNFEMNVWNIKTEALFCKGKSLLIYVGFYIPSILSMVSYNFPIILNNFVQYIYGVYSGWPVLVFKLYTKVCLTSYNEPVDVLPPRKF